MTDMSNTNITMRFGTSRVPAYIIWDFHASKHSRLDDRCVNTCRVATAVGKVALEVLKLTMHYQSLAPTRRVGTQSRIILRISRRLKSDESVVDNSHTSPPSFAKTVAIISRAKTEGAVCVVGEAMKLNDRINDQ